MARRWKIECFEFTTEGSYWTAITDIKRKRIPNSRGSYRKTSRAKTCTDTSRHRKQISVRWTQCMSWSVMFKNRIQISRLSSVDGLVCNVGDLELEASGNVWAEQMSWSTVDWCPRRLSGRRRSVRAADKRRFSSLRRPKQSLSLIHIWRCRRSYACRSRWSPYH